MAKPLISLGGGVLGASSTIANMKVCQDAATFERLAQQCGGLFGPLSGWAAANPPMAAAVLFAVGFGVSQLIQTVVGKVVDS
jgi:hypothetical protein